MKQEKFRNLDLIFMILIGATAFYLFIQQAKASSSEMERQEKSSRRDVRTVRLGNLSIATIRVTLSRSTILSFPTKPNKVILGNQGMFAIEYVERDLAIAPLQSSAQGNLFVYMEGRRFAFDLVTVSTSGDSIVMVRDEEDHNVPVTTQ